MRIFHLGVALALVGASMVVPLTAEAAAEGILLKNSNMRTTPMVQHGNIIEVLPIGSRIQVLLQGQGWNLVSKNYGKLGWVASPLMKMEQITAAVQPDSISVPVPVQPTQTIQPTVNTVSILHVQSAEPEKTYGVVQLHSNMRAGPMQAILQVLPKGSKVEILLLENKWYKVRIDNGSVGWIAGWLIEPVKQDIQIQTASTQQQAVGIVPASIDTQELNDYWTAQVNQLRSAVGLQVLTQSDVLAHTAAIWADYLGTIKQLTHVRTNGDSMHEWAKAQGIPFADRYGVNGWQENYFTENIGRDPTDANMDSAKVSLDVMLANFVAENNGPHYRTVYHEDWNSVGVGFYFDPIGDGTYQLYAAFHYASLAQ